MVVAYLFEAKGIQRFILDGGKLRNIVGASEIVESLCRADANDLLQDVLKATELEGEFARRAGGAFHLILEDTDDKFHRFRALWTLAVSQAAPGLEFYDRIGTGGNAAQALIDARAQPEQRRNGVADLLPIAGPLVRRSSRTGAAAIERIYDDEDIDFPTKRKRDHAEETRLASRFEPQSDNDRSSAFKRRWPINMDPTERRGEPSGVDFPFSGENRWVGIIHADGNGFGKALVALGELVSRQSFAAKATELFMGFSNALQRTTEGAAKDATYKVLDPEAARLDGKANDRVMPARPIVLGGDDLTIIVRGDLALPFARHFLEQFEQRSAQGFAQIKLGEAQERPKEFGGMTACAGIAFVKANQPYHLAYALAEDLCKVAKRASKLNPAIDGRVPSSIAFHRITTSFIDAYEAIVERELQVPRAGALKGQHLAMQPYRVGKIAAAEMPALGDLLQLRDWLAARPAGLGALKQLRSLIFSDLTAARHLYRRWRDSVRLASESALKEFDQLVANMAGDPVNDLPFGARGTPIFDALELLAVTGKS
jgi:hypothetical protein